MLLLKLGDLLLDSIPASALFPGVIVAEVDVTSSTIPVTCTFHRHIQLLSCPCSYQLAELEFQPKTQTIVCKGTKQHNCATGEPNMTNPGAVLQSRCMHMVHYRSIEVQDQDMQM